MEQREFIVEAEAAGQRIDRFPQRGGHRPFPQCAARPRGGGSCALQRQKHRQEPQAQGGDTILLEIPDAKPIEAVPQDIPLDIVYEDDHLLVVNKPKGMVVHRPGQPGRHAGERPALALQGQPLGHRR